MSIQQMLLAAGGEGFSGEYLQSASSGAEALSYTFAAQNLGEQSSSRVIVVVVNGRCLNDSSSGVTIGGTAMTKLVEKASLVSGVYQISAVYSLVLPIGATGDVVVTYPATAYGTAVSLYRLQGRRTGVAYHTSSSSTTSPYNTVLDVPYKGYVISGVSINNGASATGWTGLTVDYDAAVALMRASTASDTVASGAVGKSITATNAGGTGAAAMVAASFGYGIRAEYYLAVGHSNSPYVTVYPWSSSGFGTKFANPATLPAGTGLGVAFSPAGTEIAISHVNTPYITAYSWSVSGFGTKFANPATLPAGAVYSVAFSPSGTEIAIGHQTTPYVTAYPWSSSGFGTKFSDPATLPAGLPIGIAFSPAGTEIAVAHFNTPFITAYHWSSSGFGTKFTDPATLPPDIGRGISFSPAGTEVVMAHDTTPFVTAYSWSAAGFGTKFADPATLPTGNGGGIAFGTI
jgi:hypothetical protein